MADLREAKAAADRWEAAVPPPKFPRIGYFSARSGPSQIDEAFRQRLRELGYVVDQTVAIEYRWAEGRSERLLDLANELVGLRVDVLVADGTPAARAATSATKTIPVVFAVGSHPVSAGLAASMTRPAGNATGTALLFFDAGAKRLELLREAIRGLSRVAVLWNPAQPPQGALLQEIQAVAPSLNLRLHPLEARGVRDFEAAFSWIARWRPGGLLVFDDPVLVEHRRRIVDFALQQKLPTVFGLRAFVEAGGLMALTPSLSDLSRIAAVYVDKILRGADPGELPIERSTRAEIIVNLRTARALRLDIPQSVLTRADEVIE